MIDAYTWTAIVLRILAAIGILCVIVWQIHLLKPPVRNQWIRYVMLGLETIMFSNYMQSLLINFWRQPDGNLTENARHFSLIYNALSGLSSVVLTIILYRKSLQK